MTNIYHIYDLKIDIDDSILNNILKTRLLKQTWEIDEIKAINFLHTDATVLELGGCIGILSNVINRKLTNPSAHIVLEPNIKLNSAINKIRTDNNSKFILENSILDTEIKIIDFKIHPNHIMGSRVNGGQNTWETIKSNTTTLELLENKYDLLFDSIIMDTEGGEYDLFQNNFFTPKTLCNIKFLMIEFHQNPLQKKLISHLSNIFTKTQIISSNRVLIFTK